MAKIKYDPKGVEQVLKELESANRKLDSAHDGIKVAINTIKDARGANYISVDYNWLLKLPKEYQEEIEEQKEKIKKKAEQIEKYNKDIDEASLQLKVSSTIKMGSLKIIEGLGTAGEQIIDGFASAGGFIAGLFGAKQAQKSIGDWVKKDHVGSWFDEQYEKGALSGINKYSYMSYDGTAAKIFKVVGIATGYIGLTFAGGAAFGAIGNSASATTAVQGAFATGKAAVGSLKVSAAVAGLGGVGSGTQTGLQQGKSYNKSFGQGVVTGTIQAGTVFAVHYIGKGINKIVGKIKLRAQKTGTSLSVIEKDPTSSGFNNATNSVDDFANSANSSSTNFGNSTASNADDFINNANQTSSSFGKGTTSSADDFANAANGAQNSTPKADVTDFIYRKTRTTASGKVIHQVEYRDPKTGNIVTDWIDEASISRGDIVNGIGGDLKFNSNDVASAIKNGKGTIVGKGTAGPTVNEKVVKTASTSTNTASSSADDIASTTVKNSSTKTNTNSNISSSADNFTGTKQEVALREPTPSSNANAGATTIVDDATKLKPVIPENKTVGFKAEIPATGKVATPKAEVTISAPSKSSTIEIPKEGIETAYTKPGIEQKISPKSEGIGIIEEPVGIGTAKVQTTAPVQPPKASVHPTIPITQEEQTSTIPTNNPSIKTPTSPSVTPPNINKPTSTPSIEPNPPIVENNKTSPPSTSTPKTVDNIPTLGSQPTTAENRVASSEIEPPTIVKESITPKTETTNTPKSPVVEQPTSVPPVREIETPPIIEETPQSIPPIRPAPEQTSTASSSPNKNYPDDVMAIPNTNYQQNIDLRDYIAPIGLGAATITAGVAAAKNLKEYKETEKKENNNKTEEENL